MAAHFSVKTESNLKIFSSTYMAIGMANTNSSNDMKGVWIVFIYLQFIIYNLQIIEQHILFRNNKLRIKFIVKYYYKIRTNELFGFFFIIIFFNLTFSNVVSVSFYVNNLLNFRFKMRATLCFVRVHMYVCCLQNQ